MSPSHLERNWVLTLPGTARFVEPDPRKPALIPDGYGAKAAREVMFATVNGLRVDGATGESAPTERGRGPDECGCGQLEQRCGQRQKGAAVMSADKIVIANCGG